MFFNAIPDVLYPDFTDKSKLKLSKNIFRKVRPRDNYNTAFVSSKKYIIQPGETPDKIAFAAYGDPDWYWAILTVNNIVDMNTQWPLDSDELEKLIEERYGNQQNVTRHWETNRILDASENVVLEGGIIIETFMNTTQQQSNSYWPNWSFTYIDSYTVDSQNRLVSSVEKTVTAAQNLSRITNREYEYALNELKREIYLPKKSVLSKMQEELEDLLAYDTEYKITRQGYRLAEQ